MYSMGFRQTGFGLVGASAASGGGVIQPVSKPNTPMGRRKDPCGCERAMITKLPCLQPPCALVALLISSFVLGIRWEGSGHRPRPRPRRGLGHRVARGLALAPSCAFDGRKHMSGMPVSAVSLKAHQSTGVGS